MEKLQSKDLRIGNWVECEVLDGEIMVNGYEPIVQIKTIEYDWVSKEYFALNTNSDYIYLDLYKPIPLTEDWLLRFGFEITGAMDSYGGWVSPMLDGRQIRVTRGDNCYFCYHSKVQYVHQLQNLYHSLTGKELTI